MRILIVFLLVFLTGCSQEQQALDKFKKDGGSELSQCVGATGSIKWKIFKSTKHPDNVRVIQADLSKKGKTATLQWLYNLDTDVSELSYADIGGEKQSLFSIGILLPLFCL
jgi:hypothetical protein